MSSLRRISERERRNWGGLSVTQGQKKEVETVVFGLRGKGNKLCLLKCLCNCLCFLFFSTPVSVIGKKLDK